MKEKIFFALSLLLSGNILYAQNIEREPAEIPKNNINMNLAGDASLISINYERLFFIKPIFFITGQLGIGYNATVKINAFGGSVWIDEFISYVTMPHHITGNLGNGKHFFEFGIGGSFIIAGAQTYLLYPIAGYRFQKLASGKNVLKIFVNFPVIIGKDIINEVDYLFSPIGLSVGYCF